jgi:hypothetical protein
MDITAQREAPQRQAPVVMICVCRIPTTDGSGYDSCLEATSGPDEPVCVDCENSGHRNQPGWSPLVKVPGEVNV